MIAGLSPPTRGNLLSSSPSSTTRRSIPAHAGEPRSLTCRTPTPAVYPRPRGGTAPPRDWESASRGLSPPTRGNHGHFVLIVLRGRSIPAHAGEPSSGMSPRAASRVYPRPRGGTALFGPLPADSEGLSPPTRGNLLSCASLCSSTRSIPAHAGEPRRGASRPSRRAVYPRPRGGTAADPGGGEQIVGLSPPTRGNRGRPAMDARPEGSIPAHAGEPARSPKRAASRPVYPRPRGGTRGRRSASANRAGLSPPTRGNRTAGGGRSARRRSIPAHAGEPRRRPISGALRAVYPRPRGGTFLARQCARRG